MSPVILFGLLLLLTFGALVWVLKPTKPEADIQRHLTSIGRMYAVDVDGTTILKQEVLSSLPWLNTILGRVPGCLKLRQLIAQAGSNWSVSTLLLGSLVGAFLSAWLGTVFMPGLPLALALGAAVGI